MKNKKLIIAGAVAAVVVFSFWWWRNRPARKAERQLVQAAETASVATDDGELIRRMKLSKLRNYIGYELYVDVEGIAGSRVLLQDEALSAWMYVVGRRRRLSVEIADIALLSADKSSINVAADISVDSDYKRGRYSGIYPLEIRLRRIERQWRVVSMNTRSAKRNSPD
ncbi:MAG: hypothetical protein R6V06_06765 [Kiritimatiellia bacterium]